MTDTAPEGFATALAACAEGRLPPNVAVMRLLLGAAQEGQVEAALRKARARSPAVEAARLTAALNLLASAPGAFATVKAVAALAPHDAEAASAEAAVALWRAVFDRLAETAPEAGVALYGLGSPALLAAATAEVVDHLRTHRLIGPDTRVLEIGCGGGRFVAALAPLVAQVTGLDVSAGMIEAARRRCAGLANVRLAASSGRDLAGIPDRSAELILAADVFPYLVGAGREVAAAHLAEAERVLVPGGRMLILNYSYRGDPEVDARDLGELLPAAGLVLLEAGPSGFALWDAARYLAAKRA